MQFADIKNATTLSVIPDFAQTDDGLNTAFIEADKHNWTKEERIAYDNVLIKEADEKQEKIKAAEKAREEAKEEKEIEAVLGFHENGVSVPVIAKSLKITEQRVLQIIENQ